MPDGQKKNMSPIRYLIGQSLYLGSLSHLLSSLYRFSLVDQESECERDWNSYAQPIHTCLLNQLYSDSAATRVVYSFLNPASSRSLNMGMPERKKGYPRYSLVPSQARLESKEELPTQIGVISKWTQLSNIFSYAIISSSTQNKMNKREERTSHKQAVRSNRFWLGLCEWNLHSRKTGLVHLDSHFRMLEEWLT